jgi:hypothetical protein
MSRAIWWCDNCGYEIEAAGRCETCGERLLRSPIPELDVGPPGEEVGYRVYDWDGAAIGRLIEDLIKEGIRHRFEGDQLVVQANDEPRADAVVAQAAQVPHRRKQKRPKLVASGDAGERQVLWEDVAQPGDGDLAGRPAGAGSLSDWRPALYPSERWNGLAIASFVVGLLAIFPFASSIIALVLGLVGLNQLNASNDRGRGLAKWGIALGVVGLIVWGSWAFQVAADIGRAHP